MNSNKTDSFAGLKKALQNKCKIHCFLSGGGLRVVRVENKKTLEGYGEHPYFMGALYHANEDYLAGGRPYYEVYGENGIYDQYITGASQPADKVDAWIRAGHSMDFLFRKNKYKLETQYYKHIGPPREIHNRVQKTGIQEIWKGNGCIYSVSPTENPPYGSLASIIEGKNPDDPDPWFKYEDVDIETNSFEELFLEAEKLFPTLEMYP